MLLNTWGCHYNNSCMSYTGPSPAAPTFSSDPRSLSCFRHPHTVEINEGRFMAWREPGVDKYFVKIGIMTHRTENVHRINTKRPCVYKNISTSRLSHAPMGPPSPQDMETSCEKDRVIVLLATLGILFLDYLSLFPYFNSPCLHMVCYFDYFFRPVLFIDQ